MKVPSSLPSWARPAFAQWFQLKSTRDPRVWISLISDEQFLDQVRAIQSHLESNPPAAPVLLGQSCAIKDNIDVAGLSTTAGCPDYSYNPSVDAPAVALLKSAGALVLGKTTLDQFATGLVGVRSPHGPCPNALNPDYISGGSSSGSAVAVARGEVDFALGTDTAGSGRVPAAYNNLVGYKPTRGVISTRGVVPACRSLDCVSVLTRSAEHSRLLGTVLRQVDAEDPFSRPYQATTGLPAGSFTFGLPQAEYLNFFGDATAEALYHTAIQKLLCLGGVAVPIDYAPLAEAAALLYSGPWVAERYAAVGEWMEAHPKSCHPTVAKIIAGGKNLSAVSVFRAGYRLEALRRQAQALWRLCDCLVLPTVANSYRIEEVLANPVELNSRLGLYNNFVNLLDMSAVAVPVGFWPSGVSFGLNLVGPAFADERLLALAGRVLGERPVAGMDTSVQLAVVGAHLRGQPLHGQLEQLEARFLEQTRTAGNYRLYALPGTVPPKPGLVRESEGAAIEVEVYQLSREHFGTFVNAVPPPLCIGSVELADGRWVKGFLCEPLALQGAREITAFGGWRNYIGKSIAPVPLA